MGAPHLVPHDVVLLAPGAFAVVGEPVVVALARHLLPLLAHLAGLVHVALGHIGIAAYLCHLCITSHTHDGLERQIGVVCPVSGEVVGAELVGGVESVFYQIVGPGGDDVPVAVGVGCVALDARDFGGEGEHIASLLERHVGSVYLAVGYGIGAQVVGGKGLVPPAAAAILEDAGHHGLDQFGIVYQEEGG